MHGHLLICITFIHQSKNMEAPRPRPRLQAGNSTDGNYHRQGTPVDQWVVAVQTTAQPFPEDLMTCSESTSTTSKGAPML